MTATSDVPPRPRPLPVNFDKVPAALRDRPAWLVWRYEIRTDKAGKPKWTKPPLRADGRGHAKSNDESTWATFDAARAASARFDGIGLALHADLVGVDLDHVLKADTDELEPWAKTILDRFDGCYTERSPGGDGIRIFCRGAVQHSGKSGPGNRLEVYGAHSPRYLTVTGHQLRTGEVKEAQAALDWLHAEFFAKKADTPKTLHSQPGSGSVFLADEDVIRRASNARNGAKFQQLWQGDTSSHDDDASAADAALLSMLRFWTQDAAQLDRLFRRSGLMREKWDRPQAGTTYGAHTIATVLGRGGEHWKPRKDRPPPAPAGQEDRPRADPLQALAHWFVTDEQVEKMQATRLIWRRIVALSHLSVWAAPGNGGKTTLAKTAADELAAAGYTVLFFQEDASAGDLPALHEHAREHGYKLLNSTLAGSLPEDQIHVLRGLARDGADLAQFVMFFDTLKKYADLMSKGGSRDFFQLMRALTQRGATVILLGHTNKHRGVDGKLIFEGVGDVRNDVDEMFYIDATDKDAQGLVTLTIRPDKMRCAVAEATFELDTRTMQVRALPEVVDVAAIREAQQRRQADAALIEVIRTVLAGGGMNYTELLERAVRAAEKPRSRVRDVLDRYCSEDKDAPGALWTETRMRVNNTRYIALRPGAER